ncbi:MAG: hypothetical protein N4A57_06570 [Anaeromicrobium sp.]|jgi:low affinity Fe/Cu permease|uniref:hypothetical protein n=1 Tax=Anaeromicrobium sp. TaxID=1929132 RepID=UPI0025EE228D|nr:hypothetical protein [Anaeromicrobium sp.]MCT4593917.1 hypothetical protein [Anaeromicrobium sp.]
MWKLTNNRLYVISLGLIIFILLLYNHNTQMKFNRYVNEDMKYIQRNINYNVNSMAEEINEIVSKKTKAYVDLQGINSIKEYSRNYDRKLFELKRKCRLIGGKTENRFQLIWDDFNYNEDLDQDTIQDFYSKLSKEAKEKGQVELSQDHINTFKDILEFYNKKTREIYKLMH